MNFAETRIFTAQHKDSKLAEFKYIEDLMNIIESSFSAVKTQTSNQHPKFKEAIESWTIDDIENHLDQVLQLTPSSKELIKLVNQTRKELNCLKIVAHDFMAKAEEVYQNSQNIEATKSLIKNMPILELDEKLQSLVDEFINEFVKDDSYVSKIRLEAFKNLLLILNDKDINRLNKELEVFKQKIQLLANDELYLLKNNSHLKESYKLLENYQNKLEFGRHMKESAHFFAILPFLTLAIVPGFPVLRFIEEVEHDISVGSILLVAGLSSMITLAASLLIFGLPGLISATALITATTLAFELLALPLFVIGSSFENEFSKKDNELPALIDNDSDEIVDPDKVADKADVNIFNKNTYRFEGGVKNISFFKPYLDKKQAFIEETKNQLEESHNQLVLGTMST